MFKELENVGISTFKFKGTGLGVIVTSLLNYVFVGAGLALLVYLILGGFQYLTSKGDPKTAQQAQSKITNALVGFLIIFASFWIVKIIGLISGSASFSNVIK